MAADSFIFGGNTGLTYEELKRRRAIAQAIASRQRGYPKNIGEGLTYLGESIGDTIGEMRLRQAEKAQGTADAARIAALERLQGGAPAAQPPVTPDRVEGRLSAPPAAPRPPPVSAPPRAVPPIGSGAGSQAAAPIPRPPPPPPPPPPPVLPSGPSGEALTSGPPPSEFEAGGMLSPAPLAAPNLEPVFPGEEGIPSQQAGILPSSGYLAPPTAAAAPPSTPAPPVAATSANELDTADYPAGPVGAPTVSPELRRAQEFQRSQGRPITGPAGQPQTAPVGDAPGSILGPQSALDRFIAKQEGFRPTAYWDYKQYSIGHGTRGRPGETISREEAGQRLQSEVANARQSVEDFAPDAPPGVKDALTSLTYNAGSGWQQSGLGRMIREGRYDEARDRFQQYIRAGGTPLPGLASRRQAELTNFWDQPQQDGGGNIQLAAYAPSGGAGGTPIPGMGGAGSPRLQPQVPPLEGPPPPPGEQVTPTDIEPMPSTAQFGPPVGRFSRSDAPVPGIPPAVALPPTAPLPPIAAPVPALPATRPSREPIPQAFEEEVPDPGPAPPPPQQREPSRAYQAAQRMALDPNAGPAAQAYFNQVAQREEEKYKFQQQLDLSDYANKRAKWEQDTTARMKWEQTRGSAALKQQEQRTGLQKAQAEAEKAERELAAPETKEIGGVIYQRTPATPAQPAGPWTVSPGSPGKELKIPETEGKTLLALRRSTVAEDQLKNTGGLAKLTEVARGKAPFGAGNYLVSPEYQKVKSAADAWILHTVRHESGAAIKDDELPQMFKIYFPLPGDDEQQIAIKDARRRNATRGLYDSLSGDAKGVADKFFEERKTRRTQEPEGTLQVNPKTGRTRRVIGGHWEYTDAD